MPCLRESRLLPFLLLHFAFLAAPRVGCLQSDGFHFPDPDQGDFIRSQHEFSVVRPRRVSQDGQFLSFLLTHHFGHRRDKRDLGPPEKYVYYALAFRGRDLTFNLTANSHLLANEYVLERRSGASNVTLQRRASGENACHLTGSVMDSSFEGAAAISTCKGLKGFFSLSEGHYFIEPVQGYEEDVQPHVIYQSTPPSRTRRSPQSRGGPSPCGLRDALTAALRVELEREAWGRKSPGQAGPRRMAQRSVSRERWVETMVVADSKLIEYHGVGNVESYIFTIMNMVAGIFHDASVGNAIHIILVRLVLLPEEEKGLKITHHADNTLSSFCTWQKNVNPQSDTHPAHHDVAVLITRKDICASMNQPCETLGLSHLSGMCQPHRSCNINEDSGLPVALTVAHELGHSFGIQHDGQGNDCDPTGRQPYIMSRQLQYDTSPPTWSPCSRESITRFLDRGWGSCLDDRPSKTDLSTSLEAPGVKYTIQAQCQLQYGPNATSCPQVENICQILWCSVNGSCRSKMDAPADGTRCGPNKWCISGECVIVGKLPETVNGAWGLWSPWSHCSRTCGAGIQSAERECDRPKPEFGGKYCMGERKRYRVCNSKRCGQEQPTFRQMQCSEFDTVPFKNQLYQWIPVISTVYPCELHCRPVDDQFSEKMLDAVTDGTPCFVHNSSRSVCVNGVCKEVGCDYGINSNAVEDRCGVCLGDGSSCQTVRRSFEEGEGHGYVDVGLIPEGARDIVVQEVEEAANFLALRGQDTEEYYLNGRYIIQWKGEYEAGGATFYYERSGNLENLTSPGPTREPIMIQLLFQEKNPGIKYEYTIRKNRQRGNEILQPEYRWKHGAWTDCSTTCGAGVQNQPVRCFEAETGVVDEFLCDPKTRPKDRQRKCKKIDCPARWWVGAWQPCSAPCGPSGLKKRTVLCVRSVGSEERVLHPGDCRILLKPKPAVPCNRDVPCGSEWAVGPWSECSASCGGGIRSRTVTCRTAPRRRCQASSKPRSHALCSLHSCPSARRKPPPASRKAITHTSSTLETETVTTVTTDPGLPASSNTASTAPSSEDNRHQAGGRNATVPSFTADDEGSTDGFLFPGNRHKLDYITEDSAAAGRHGPWASATTTSDPHTTPPPSTPAETSASSTWTASYSPPMKLGPAWGPVTTQASLPSSGQTDGAPETLPTSPQMAQDAGFTGTSESDSTANPTGSRSNGPPVNMNIFWVVGNWSECSTSCGLGAMWRAVTCSSPQEALCSDIRRPDPARRCHIRPCATWHSGDWGKCPEGCLGGSRQRDVLCMDTQSQRVLRPYHCQATGHRPPSSEPCLSQPCQAWQFSPWGKCSKRCGEGQRERLVYCPEPGRCEPTQKPNSSEPCNQHLCFQWQAMAWEECSVSCGGGVQHRVVTCVKEESGGTEGGQCERSSRPDSVQKCNLQRCERGPVPRCTRDSMSTRFCEKLKLLGRCSLGSIWKQCCITCGG
ncbi:A disintegrin and metalloproteinase with thrombospondin motifs 12 isoform X1 [Brienomyrus brachyistius]|uniref:A disintegrin and metalloproteinase with thrombospondin motifs 12 isoform X1 n=2 Tax=Brienomyrus brachyistius TaxID=42636 RepID=UPI0020B41194|nr:A disintegrin and metalloproteinase with thrombospondin motifs 12 isoform X1 [Brienomyrus brachyistius]